MSVRTVPGALDILNQKLGGNAGDIPASSTKEYALEKIYRTLGGEETLEGVNTTSEIIEKIAGVAEGGGGGSSDFSTAEVTMVDLSTTYPDRFGELEYPFTLDIIGAIEEGLTSQMVFNSASDVKNAVLYNNQQRIYNIGVIEGIVDVSGNAEIVDNATDPIKTDLVITGNCTLYIGFRK